MSRALVVVDVQRGFCEGGALAASDTRSLLGLLQSFIAEAHVLSKRVRRPTFCIGRNNKTAGASSLVGAASHLPARNATA